jgi:hypothetical protein
VRIGIFFPAIEQGPVDDMVDRFAPVEDQGFPPLSTAVSIR